VTLNVSLRVHDGIVIASDSLSTLSQHVNQKMNVQGKCEKCGEQIELKDVQTPPIAVPSSTWPYTQKAYPITREFGLMTWGTAFVNNRSIYNHVIALSEKIAKGETFAKVSERVVNYFKDQLVAEWTKTAINPALQPDTLWPFGFQLSGYVPDADGEPIATTQVISIGKVPKIEEAKGLGVSVTGDISLVRLLWPNGKNSANFSVFSMQDAIDYAQFLIRTTSDFQRFSGSLPRVGGDIDIALITQHRGFKWIAQKELYRMLEREALV
jgi:hypothetical protein